MGSKGPGEGNWGWKKITLVTSLALSVIFGPMIAVSTPLMNNYLGYCEKNKGTDFSKWLHMKVGSVSRKTLRPELSAKAYEKYVDMYHNPDDPSQDGPDVAEAWFEWGKVLKDTRLDDGRPGKRRGIELLEEWLDTYGEGHPLGLEVKDALFRMKNIP